MQRVLQGLALIGVLGVGGLAFAEGGWVRILPGEIKYFGPRGDTQDTQVALNTLIKNLAPFGSSANPLRGGKCADMQAAALKSNHEIRDRAFALLTVAYVNKEELIMFLICDGSAVWIDSVYLGSGQ